MCLILTIAAAVIFAALYIHTARSGRKNRAVFTTMLMFASAALMWCVDGIASVLEGEAFFDISREDTVLGIIIVSTGFLVFALLSVLELKKKKTAADAAQ